MPPHPTPREFSEFLQGTLPPEQSDRLAEHLEVCEPCQETVRNLEPHGDTLMQSFRERGEPAAVDAACRDAMRRAAELVPGAGDDDPSKAETDAAATIAQLLSQLKSARIVAEEQWSIVEDAAQSASDAGDLLRRLTERGVLTKFQAQTVAQGKARGLAFGEYVVVDRIGAGGMGQVFKARHRRMDRLVALKVMSKDAVKDADAVKRFEREVKAAARLNHPNIVAAYDAGRQGNVHFLVMQYVDGGDLSRQVKEHGPLPVREAVEAILQAARGLAYAHAEGVVHRDIKPANLLRDKKGVVRVLDLGLARFEDPLGRGHDEGLTASGAVMGTVDYMAPEQAFNTRDAGPAADVYSLGCSLYRLLTGRAPYAGETAVQKILAHREQPIPSPAATVPGVVTALDGLFRLMLAKDPDDRPTMAEVVAALERIIASPDAPFEPGGSPLPATVGTPPARSWSPAQPQPSFPQTVPQATVPRALSLPASGAHRRTSAAGGRRPPRRLLPLAAAGGLIFIPLGIWIIVHDPKGNESARHHVSDGSTFIVETSSPSATTPTGTRGSPSPPVASAVSPMTEPAGGFALRIDGQADPIDFSGVQLHGPGPWTIEGWITPREPLPSNGRNAIIFMVDPAWFSIRDASAGPKWSAGGPVFKPPPEQVSREKVQVGKAAHVALVRSKEGVSFFVDGELQSDPLIIGAFNRQPRPRFCPPPSAQYRDKAFYGDVDELRISSAARYPGPPARRRFDSDADTLLLYHFEEGSGDVLNDASGQGHHGKITSGKWVGIAGGLIAK